MPNGITRKEFLKTATLGSASLLVSGIRGNAFEVQGPLLDVLLK